MFQFTRPQGARPFSFMPDEDTPVSIHAPARGATEGLPRADGRAAVSIHAPARGATSTGAEAVAAWVFQFTRPQGARLHVVYLGSFPKRFNSRARKGRDEMCMGVLICSIVSIHAPARGATLADGFHRVMAAFQFTRPQGARPASTPPARRLGGFNSRARKGRDKWYLERVIDLKSFNSRARKGRDTMHAGCGAGESVSIHAPARGATTSHNSWLVPTTFQFTRPQGARLEFTLDIEAAEKFQFTRPQGARRAYTKVFTNCQCFNSRARKGRDYAALRPPQVQRSFQFTRPQGARLLYAKKMRSVESFNSRARKGRDSREKR